MILASRRIVTRVILAAGSPEAARAATSQFVGLLAQYVRRTPWVWWTWRRLQLQEDSSGATVFDSKALPTEKHRYVQSLGEQPA